MRSIEKKTSQHSVDGQAAIMLVIFTLLVTRVAWLSEDSYISFRVVDNFISGYGLRWNIAERVQAFTNPLWVLVVSIAYRFTHEIYYTVLALSITISTVTASILFLKSKANPVGLFAIFLLISSSRAYVDFSTSGLENPLLHLLIVLFFFQVRSPQSPQKYLKALSLASLIGVTRLDTTLLAAPACFLLFMTAGSRRWRDTWIGLAPLLAWELFSLIYYGSLVPNTFYAKIPFNVSRAEFITQGILYLVDAAAHDPFTTIAIVFGLVCAVPIRDTTVKAFALGVILQILYVIVVGGDYMAGRFLTTAVLSSCCLISTYPFPSSSRYVIAVISSWLLVSVHARNFSTFTPLDDFERPTGILEEREAFAPYSGLANARRGRRLPDYKWATLGEAAKKEGVSLITWPFIGLYGFHAGHSVHIVDHYGLADAFVSQLPTRNSHVWTTGHMKRVLPNEYLLSLKSGENAFKDKNLARLYDETLLMTRAPLFSWSRIKLIFSRLLPWKSRNLLTREPKPTLLYREVRKAPVSDKRWNAPGNILIPSQGIKIDLQSESTEELLALSLEHKNHYAVRLFKDNQEVYSFLFDDRPNETGDMREERLAIPIKVAKRGYNSIVIEPHPIFSYSFSLEYLSLGEPISPRNGS